MSGNFSAYVKIDMKSGNDFVSPVIDLQRTSLSVVHNEVANPEDPDAPPEIYPVDESQPTGATGGSRHISSPLTQEITSSGFYASFKYKRPNKTEIALWFRTCLDGEDITKRPWKKATPEGGNLPYTARKMGQWKDARYTVGGPGGTLTPFTQLQTKIVMNATYSGAVPGVKDLQTKTFGS